MKDFFLGVLWAAFYFAGIYGLSRLLMDLAPLAKEFCR